MRTRRSTPRKDGGALKRTKRIKASPRGGKGRGWKRPKHSAGREREHFCCEECSGNVLRQRGLSFFCSKPMFYTQGGDSHDPRSQCPLLGTECAQRKRLGGSLRRVHKHDSSTEFSDARSADSNRKVPGIRLRGGLPFHDFPQQALEPCARANGSI